MKLNISQKYYCKCLYEDNKILNYTEFLIAFKQKFNNTEFVLKEDTIKRLLTPKKICISQKFKILKLNKKEIIIYIFPIKKSNKKR